MADVPSSPGPAAASEPLTADSVFDASAFEQSLVTRDRRPRWAGWRLRVLLLAALAGWGVVFGVMFHVASSPHLETGWTIGTGELPRVAGDGDPAWQALADRRIEAISGIGPGAVEPLRLDRQAQRHSARWTVDSGQRLRQVQLQEQIAALLARGPVRVWIEGGRTIDIAATPRGLAGLNPAFWPLSALALLLYLSAVGIVLQRPDGANALYAAMAACQALNLLFVAAEPARGLGMPAGFALLDLWLRSTLDVATAVLAVAACALHPRPVPHAAAVIAAAAAAAALWLGAQLSGPVPGWWSTQSAVLGLGLAAAAVSIWSNRLSAHAFAALMRRFTVVAVATLALLTLSTVVIERIGGASQAFASIAALAWQLFLSALLLLVPFLPRSQRLLPEFALLAGIGTVASSLALIVVAVFSLGPVAALLFAAGIAAAVYVGARQWILNRVVGARVLTTERTFEQLYRVAREVRQRPAETAALLTRLLQDLFDPQETLTVPRRMPGARAVGGGTALYVPLPTQGGSTDLDQVLIMRHAGRGKRIFTQEDAQLAERVVEQLLRAVAYDLAVERGRAEERQRIAQDLHDDIGARLLTLMYKATDREMEEYLRHTLQDLKTLTRGLAASQHRLSDAAGEWKADLEQRLAAARLRLEWNFNADVDVTLAVGQWSAITRILRELVSNVIAHAAASRVEVELAFESGVLALTVSDDGRGGDPATWSHGLGLGGVRKRARSLGGQVQWAVNGRRGIRCEVRLPGLGTAGAESG